MNAFLKTIGTAEHHLPERWMSTRPEVLERVWFSKTPRSISRGDILIYYGAGTRRVCAVVEVTENPYVETSPPPHWTREDRDRWKWAVRVMPHIAIPADDAAPSLETIGLNPLRVRRQSHIRLARDEARRMIAAIAHAGTRAGRYAFEE